MFVCCPQDDVPLLLWIRLHWNKQGSTFEHCCVFMSARELCPTFVRLSVLAQGKLVCYELPPQAATVSFPGSGAYNKLCSPFLSL